jgi:hypothetical protein
LVPKCQKRINVHSFEIQPSHHIDPHVKSP